MNYLPFVAFLAVIVVLLLLAGRARRRQAQTQADLVQRIEVGTDVMTTSGLYGTVVALNADSTVQLSIAPGVEVRWELAALRDAAALPPQMADRNLDAHGGGTPDSPEGIRLEKDDVLRGDDRPDARPDDRRDTPDQT